MKAVGIIAEYNPFHLGHLRQIQRIRETLGEDTPIVVAMSGAFVQRGEPSIADKWSRGHSALLCGADLVVELPFTFACAPAPRFADGGVALLNRLGILSHLSFGCETEDLAPLKRIAEVLAAPTSAMEESIRESLRDGDAYPVAREKALLRHFSDDVELSAKLPNLLRAPNTILALEYLRAITESGAALKPLLVRREGAGYHDTDATESIMSATGIREELLKIQCGNTSSEHFAGEAASRLTGKMPPEACSILLRDWHSGIAPVFPDTYIPQMIHSLSIHNEEWLQRIAYMGDSLSGHLKNCTDGLRLAPRETLTDAFSQRIYTRHYANTRVNRALISLLTGQTQRDIEDLSAPQYIRVLGFTRKGQFLLKVMREAASLPIITKSSDFREFGKNEPLTRMAELDLLSQEMWNQAAGYPFGEEFQRQVIREKGKKKRKPAPNIEKTTGDAH